MTTERDPMDDPEYQKWLVEMAKHCQADDPPCQGCQAGGECDGPSDDRRDDEDGPEGLGLRVSDGAPKP